MGSSQSSEDARLSARGRKVCCGCTTRDEISLLLDGDDTDPLHTPAENTSDGYSIIQMGCGTFFCKEQERVAVLDVVRFGDSTGRATVEYATVEASAKVGEKYLHKEGMLDFQPGDTTKQIEVPVIDDDCWDATLEFGVQLKNVQGAQLGLYLSRCKVMIIDDDAFPTNKYARYFRNKEEDAEHIPDLGLFAEYCKMNLRNPIVKWGSLKTIFLDQIKNLYGILLLYLQMYLVDVVLRPGDHEASESSSLIPNVLIIPGSRMYTAMVVGGMYIVPFLFLHIVDYRKLAFGIAGQSRLHLQANLLRKFLNYREEHRCNLSVGTITMTMVRDVPEVVNNGFMKALEIMQIFGSLGLAVLFILSNNPQALLPISVLPVIMGIFLCCRGGITVSTGREMDERQNEVVQTITEATQAFRMVADFDIRAFMVSTYETRIRAFNAAGKEASQVATNNSYLSPWLTTILIGGYMTIAPFQLEAFGGNTSLGAFLATLNIFKQLGDELSHVYLEFMEIQRCIGALRNVAHLMNLETDLLPRLRTNRMRRREGEETRQLARRQSVISGGNRSGMTMTDKGEEVFTIDTVPIALSSLSFAYPCKPPILQNIRMKFDQGKLHAFIGRPHEGKATLLKLIGQVLVPDMSDEGLLQAPLFVPPHLRVLNLSTDTFFLGGSLMLNLIFNTEIHLVGGIDRIRRICEMLSFPEELLSHVIAPDGTTDAAEAQSFLAWSSHLSHSDYTRINLARAFIMNPEFLVLHKPTMGFDDSERMQILSLIRRHIDERGLQLTEESRKFRRRRTVLFSSASEQGLVVADSVYKIGLDGIHEISKEEAVGELRKDQSMTFAKDAYQSEGDCQG